MTYICVCGLCKSAAGTKNFETLFVSDVYVQAGSEVLLCVLTELYETRPVSMFCEYVVVAVGILCKLNHFWLHIVVWCSARTVEAPHRINLV